MTPERRQQPNPRHEPLPLGRRKADVWRFVQRFGILVTTAALAGSGIGWVTTVSGHRVVGTSDDMREVKVGLDSANAKTDRNYRALTQTDSAHEARMTRIERILELSSVLQCVQMPSDAPQWAQRQCDAVIAEARPR